MNYIYDYYTFHLGPKTINNFFLKAIFKPMKKVYKEKEIRYWIFTIKTAIYKTFILSFEYPLIYIKEEAILKEYQELFYLKHYLEKAKEWYWNRNKNDEAITI